MPTVLLLTQLSKSELLPLLLPTLLLLLKPLLRALSTLEAGGLRTDFPASGPTFSNNAGEASPDLWGPWDPWGAPWGPLGGPRAPQRSEGPPPTFLEKVGPAA